MRNALLTIDDSPNEFTSSIASYLAAKKIQAVFFCIGRNIEQYIDESEIILKCGHVIGNHSYSHQKFSKLSINECIEEIDKTEYLINELHKSLDIQRKRKYFRFPYGDKGVSNKFELQKLLKVKGFEKIHLKADVEYSWYRNSGLDDDTDIFWTFDCEDYRISLLDENFDLIDVLNHISVKDPTNGGSLVSGFGTEIILIHDYSKTHTKFPDYYKTIISRIEEQGISFNEEN